MCRCANVPMKMHSKMKIGTAYCRQAGEAIPCFQFKNCLDTEIKSNIHSILSVQFRVFREKPRFLPETLDS